MVLTISRWLISEGFTQCKNEPCLFINTDTGMKVLLYVDDLIVRGSPDESSKFHDQLEKRFDCREGSRQLLTPDHPVDFTGLTLTMEKGVNSDYYYIDQSSAIATFLVAHQLDDCPVRDCPMTDPKVLTRKPDVVGEEHKWCSASLCSEH